jgi:membrane-bound serine protease (ClpP class)
MRQFGVDRVRPRLAALLAALLAAFPSSGVRLPQARGEEPADLPVAVTLSVRLPITGTRDTQVRGAILRQLGRLQSRAPQRGLLVLRFDASAADADSSDFGRALDLARFLSSDRLNGVKTVAWLPEDVAGHAVLVAMACDEIVMAGEATLGPASGPEDAVDAAMRAAYREIPARRRTVPGEVAVGMLDRQVRVLRVSTEGGEEFVAAEHLQQVRDRTAVVAVEEMEPRPISLTGGWDSCRAWPSRSPSWPVGSGSMPEIWPVIRRWSGAGRESS